MILITGATGNFGKATIGFLLKKNIPANSISALVRSREKATDLIDMGINIKLGDYDDYSSLVSAFKGVDKLLLVSGSDVFKRGKQQENAVNAAKEAGVKHIVYTSFERKNETDTSPIAFIAKTHTDTEEHIKASGLTYTIMRNSLYADVLPMFMGEKVLETGIVLPAGNGKAAFTTRGDMAEAAANILAGTGHENREYTIAGLRNYSFEDVAAILSKVSGKQVTYTDLPATVYQDIMSKAGVPAELAGVVAGFSEAIRQGEFLIQKTDLENLLHRKPTTLDDYFKLVYAGN
jgi:NAD(P)H dehydrogenase (quinone)